jgi:hypothetical protein
MSYCWMDTINSVTCTFGYYITRAANDAAVKKEVKEELVDEASAQDLEVCTGVCVSLAWKLELCVLVDHLFHMTGFIHVKARSKVI